MTYSRFGFVTFFFFLLLLNITVGVPCVPTDPNSGFLKIDSHETLRISEGFGAKGNFSFGTYLLPKVGRNK